MRTGGALLVCMAAISLYSAGSLDVLRQTYEQRWGVSALSRFDAWRKLLSSTEGSDTERIRRVNTFFNQQIQFGEDAQIWGQADYWATPLETLGRGVGDCEDFAIAKYFSLLHVGIAPQKLRLIYVRAKTGNSSSEQAHMVLAYYPFPESDPLVLDNLIDDIRSAARRSDLVPVFSFNISGIFNGLNGSGGAVGGNGRLSRWEDLLRKVKAEGFE